MNDAFPFQIPERLPIRIEPWPIVEATFETRFVSPEPWATMPGLLFAQIRERYPEQKTLPVAQVPEELRRQDAALIHLPLIQFLSGTFLIQLGPRVVSLVTKPNTYPGWTAIQQELGWLIERFKAAGFIGETERLSARYIDFFGGDVFNALRLGLQVNGQPLRGLPTDLATVLRQGALTIRLSVTNGAIVATKDGPKPGSVLDVDAWFGPMEVDLFANDLAREDLLLRKLGPRGWGRVHHFRNFYAAGWGGNGRVLSPKALDAFFRFVEEAQFPSGIPSVFLTDRGGIELCWEDREGEPVQIEFTGTGAEFYQAATGEEGVVAFDGLPQLARRLSA